MNIQAVPKVARNIGCLLTVTQYIQAVPKVARDVPGFLMVTVYIQAVLALMDGEMWVRAVLSHGRLPTTQDLADTTSERTWAPLA